MHDELTCMPQTILAGAAVSSSPSWFMHLKRAHQTGQLGGALQAEQREEAPWVKTLEVQWVSWVLLNPQSLEQPFQQPYRCSDSTPAQYIGRTAPPSRTRPAAAPGHGAHRTPCASGRGARAPRSAAPLAAPARRPPPRSQTAGRLPVSTGAPRRTAERLKIFGWPVDVLQHCSAVTVNIAEEYCSIYGTAQCSVSGRTSLRSLS